MQCKCKSYTPPQQPADQKRTVQKHLPLMLMSTTWWKAPVRFPMQSAQSACACDHCSLPSRNQGVALLCSALSPLAIGRKSKLCSSSQNILESSDDSAQLFCVTKEKIDHELDGGERWACAELNCAQWHAIAPAWTVDMSLWSALWCHNVPNGYKYTAKAAFN